MEIIYRKAGIKDIPLLIELRFAYFKEDGQWPTDGETQILKTQLADYFNEHIQNNTFIGLLAETDGKVVAVAYMAVNEKPANLRFISGRTGTILNVLTLTGYRRKGIATQLLKRILLEAKKLGVTLLELSATDEGVELYRKLGFTPTSYTLMVKQLSSDE